MTLLGFLGAFCVGVFLGLFGGGGSILTVPLLIYVFGVPPIEATSYSLFIVGVTAAVGGVQKIRIDESDLKIAAIFAPASIAAVYATRRWLLPSLPETVIETTNFVLTLDSLIVVLFAVLMIAAGLMMLRPKSTESKKEPANSMLRILIIVVEAAIIGVLTGLVGAGGGFIIVPALIYLFGLDVKKAVGTSLIIIAAKSLIGFTGDLGQISIDFQFLAMITGLAVLGIIAGIAVAKRVAAKNLQSAFGWFIVVVGIAMLVSEAIAQIISMKGGVPVAASSG